MIREMRRKDKKLTIDESIEILKNNAYGVLSTVSENGYPYGVPVNYIYFNNSIYFHGADKGHKLDNISNDDRVSFCVVGDTKVLPDQFNTKYESVIVFGRVTEVNKDEKSMALIEFLKKYSEDFMEKGKEYIQEAGKVTKVMKINIDHISGKAKK